MKDFSDFHLELFWNKNRKYWNFIGIVGKYSILSFLELQIFFEERKKPRYESRTWLTLQIRLQTRGKTSKLLRYYSNTIFSFSPRNGHFLLHTS
jgi:hypothetical protein